MSEIDYKQIAEQWAARADGERRLAVSLQKQLDAAEAQYEAEHTARLAAEQRVRELEGLLKLAARAVIQGMSHDTDDDEEEERPRFKMDANGNLTRIEGAEES